MFRKPVRKYKSARVNGRVVLCVQFDPNKTERVPIGKKTWLHNGPQRPPLTLSRRTPTSGKLCPKCILRGSIHEA